MTSQDIYNKRSELRREELKGKTPTDALVDMMNESGDYAMAVETDDERHVNMLFFSHFKAIELAQAYPEVLLIDCIYRTNMYNMPLCHFAGVAPTGHNFSIGFSFLSGETDPEYTWVLAAIKGAVYGDNLHSNHHY